MRYRQVVTYKHYFDDFFAAQSQAVRKKIIKVFEIIEYTERIPTSYLKHIAGSDGLYEIRIMLSGNIFRVFCFFDDGRFVVLLSGFQKKTQKTPKNEIDKAKRLMMDYYTDKNNETKQ